MTLIPDCADTVTVNFLIRHPLLAILRRHDILSFFSQRVSAAITYTQTPTRGGLSLSLSLSVTLYLSLSLLSLMFIFCSLLNTLNASSHFLRIIHLLVSVWHICWEKKSLIFINKVIWNSDWPLHLGRKWLSWMYVHLHYFFDCFSSDVTSSLLLFTFSIVALTHPNLLQNFRFLSLFSLPSFIFPLIFPFADVSPALNWL